jgi:ABC-type multidrug transport system permease subunit
MRLVNAEFLKLRKRRGLVISGLVLTVLPMVVAYTTLVILHANNSVKNGPAGGMENFSGSMEVLTLLSAVAAILVGSTLGTGDLGAGVFRELVVTGRSRIALFLARVPAGLGLLLVVVGGAFAITAIASIVFAGSEGPHREQVGPGEWETTLGYLAPSGTLLLQSAGWLALSTAVAMVLALGVASLVGSRGTSIGILLGWWIVAMPLLQAMGVLGSLRQGFVGAAIERVGPSALVPPEPTVSMSLGVAVAVLLTWMAAPLAAGAWRTATRDA